MKITLPLFVQTHRPPDQAGTVYMVRPLFFSWPEEHDRRLSRAMAKLVKALRKHLDELGNTGKHRELAEWSFRPEVELERLELRLDLHEQMFRGYFPVVSFRCFDRRLAFCPQAPDVWFEINRGETTRDRAAAVYQQHFRRLKRQQENLAARLSLLERKQQVWIAHIDLDVDARREFKTPPANLFALLGGAQEFRGAQELQRVGRCLDWQYPDGLRRALHRDALADRLEELLASPDNRPVLLVGPRQAGKTALVHECVFRKVARHTSPYVAKRNVWLVSPQRLISGMSYVGQWENRLLAILRHVRRKRHTLYFDDVLGLYRAGVSASANLSVADVLKPYIERRDVRVLGEMTPEQLRVFRERDRGLADMFHLVPVEETNEEDTLRILLAAQRLLEVRHGCRYDLDALPTALDLTRRYVRDAAMPGKAAAFLANLAVKHQNKDIRRGDVLAEFHATSGLDVAMLDTRARLVRRDVVEALAWDIIGQPEALEAMADVVAIAKARLNDPSRPLGSLLFLGPTGVGKTQSAKALAKYLFGDAGRLLRFDMNEFVTAQAAARLAGVFDRPEGLLTSEVRRQPFSVILLDEIEKAHPDVFDLLLQVLGEGRLTDGLGRTADFTNTVIILTSNLGTRQAAERVGFDRDGAAEAAAYVKAVEDFFRPEFFNRLDRIVPFHRLGRQELARIAEMTLHEVLAREGLVRRRCALQIAPEAMEWVIECGYHPVLGARAMKRAVEQELVQPLSRELTNLSPATPTVLQIARREEKIAVQAVGLANAVNLAEARRPARLENPRAWLERVRQALDRLGGRCREHRPSMEFTAGAISPEQYHYLACEELLKGARDAYWRLRGALEQQAQGHGRPSLAPKGMRSHTKHRTLGVQWSYEDQTPAELFAVQDINEYLSDLADQAAATLDEPEVETALRRLIDHAALLEVLGPSDDGWRHERVLLVVRSLDEQAAPLRRRLAKDFLGRFSFSPLAPPGERGAGEESFGLDVRLAFGSLADPASAESAAEGAAQGSDDAEDPALQGLVALLLEGHNAAALARFEEGTHLFTDEQGRLAPLQALVWPIDEHEAPQAALRRCVAAHRVAQHQGLYEGAEAPFRFRPIVRVYAQPRNVVLDLRTGHTAHAAQADFTSMLLSALPLPAELRELPP